MATLAQLNDIIDACRAADVRVYADAVINHMTGEVMMHGKTIVMKIEIYVNVGVQKDQHESLDSLLIIFCITKTTALNFLLV